MGPNLFSVNSCFCVQLRSNGPYGIIAVGMSAMTTASTLGRMLAPPCYMSHRFTSTLNNNCGIYCFYLSDTLTHLRKCRRVKAHMKLEFLSCTCFCVYYKEESLCVNRWRETLASDVKWMILALLSSTELVPSFMTLHFTPLKCNGCFYLHRIHQ